MTPQQALEALERVREKLVDIASFPEGEVVSGKFDEPRAATSAREALLELPDAISALKAMVGREVDEADVTAIILEAISPYLLPGTSWTVASQAFSAISPYLRPPVEQQDVFNFHRVREWALSNPRKSAATAFTASTDRNVAYLIEELLMPPPVEQRPCLSPVEDKIGCQSNSTDSEKQSPVEQQTVSQWRPIETAPKDSRGSLLFWLEDEGFAVKARWRRPPLDETAEECWWCFEVDCPLDLCGNATHWMEMPDGPTQHFSTPIGGDERESGHE